MCARVCAWVCAHTSTISFARRSRTIDDMIAWWRINNYTLATYYQKIIIENHQSIRNKMMHFWCKSKFSFMLPYFPWLSLPHSTIPRKGNEMMYLFDKVSLFNFILLRWRTPSWQNFNLPFFQPMTGHQTIWNKAVVLSQVLKLTFLAQKW